MNNDWLNHPALKNLNPAKKQLLQELMTNSNGLSMDKMLPLLMGANSKMKSQGLSFTPQETAAITELLSARLSPAERTRFEMLRKMMGNM